MKFIIPIVLAAFMLASCNQEQGTTSTAQLEIEPPDQCFLEIPDGFEFDCGYLTVPEFHDLRSEETFKLGAIRLHSTSNEPKEPIFFGNGGPGGSAFALLEVSVFSDFDGYFRKLLENHDLVFFTQRGTAYSSPHLMCSAVNGIADNYFAGAYPTWNDLELAKIEALKGCYDDLKAGGINFAAFNSLENAADLNALREAFGYEKIIYYGESYGTLLGQHVMREYPETLTSVVLDGARTLTYPSWETALDARYEAALDHLVSLCAEDEECASAYPALEADIARLYRRLKVDPYEISVGEEKFYVDGQQFSVAIYDALYDVSKARFIPHVVDSMLKNKSSDAVPGMMVGPMPAQGETGIALPMHYAFVCSEDPTNSIEETRVLETLRFDLVPDYIKSDAGEYIALCEHMDLPTLPEETDRPVSIDVPVLILNGGFDPVTPAMASEPISEQLSTVYTVDFPFGDHVQGATDTCSHSIMLQFLADPTKTPDTSCAANSGNFEWYIQ